MLKNRKIVVTGGAGFIGSHIVDALINAGNEVVVVDNFIAGKIERVNKNAIIVRADIRNRNQMIRAFEGADAVFHEAALPRVQFSIAEPEETFSVNAHGTQTVLEAARVAGVRRLIYAASSSAYGNQDILPLNEEMKPDPLSPYGAQKYFGEVLCKQYAMHFGLETVSLRYFNVYGSRLDPNGAYALVIGTFLRQKRNGEPLTITGNGNQTRDFTHVSDVARANLLALDSDLVGKGEVINIGAGDNHSINTLASYFDHTIEYIPERVEPKDTRADNSKAKFLLGWQPKISLKDGVMMLREEWGI